MGRNTSLPSLGRFLCVGALMCASCGVEKDPQEVTPALSTLNSSDIVWKGIPYKWLHEAQYAAPSPAQEEPIIDGTAEASVKPTTPEELAEALRPILLLNGQVYARADVDIEGARAIWAGFSAPNTSPHDKPAKPSASQSNGLDTRFSAYIIGTDDRSYLGSGRTSYPFSAVAHWQSSDGSFCTATMIGPHTAATAAHCVMNSNGYSKGVIFGGNSCSVNSDCSSPVCTAGHCAASFVPALDASSPAGPFGSFAPVSISVPSGWVGGNYDYDYAMLDFAPITNPGNATGWMGTTDTSSGTMKLAGYDQDKSAGHQMWYRTGTVTSTTSTRRLHNLDTYSGTSGSALYVTLSDGYPYMTGINSTENKSCFFWSCSYWNEASRWNSTVYTYFHTATGGDWP